VVPFAYLSPPVTCERTGDIVRRHHGALETRPGETRVSYQVPEHAAADVREFFARTAAAQFEPPFLARMPGGRVFGSGVVLSPDGSSIARDVSLDFGKPLDDHWLLGFGRIRPPVKLKGTTGVAATALGSGYCHWLLEELPRLLALRGKQCDTIIAHTKTQFGREAVDAIGFTGVTLEPRRTSHYACEELLIPSLMGTAGFPTPTLIEAILDFTRTLPRPLETLGGSIYISREKARRRRITNEAALWAELEKRGFKKIHLEDLSWSEQIALFERAKVVVAPHGAGLANLVFCPAGTRVVECFNRAYVDGYFWRLAALNQLDYRPVVAASSEPLGSALAANRLDFAADIPQVLQALS
jgi:hypothetical protein